MFTQPLTQFSNAFNSVLTQINLSRCSVNIGVMNGKVCICYHLQIILGPKVCLSSDMSSPFSFTQAKTKTKYTDHPCSNRNKNKTKKQENKYRLNNNNVMIKIFNGMFSVTLASLYFKINKKCQPPAYYFLYLPLILSDFNLVSSLQCPQFNRLFHPRNNLLLKVSQLTEKQINH